MASKNSVDERLMLLSAEWFAPYWPYVGVDLKFEHRQRFKESARRLVADFVGTAVTFWAIDFSPQRQTKTYEAFLKSLHALPQDAAAEVSSFICGSSSSNDSDSNDVEWLFASISELAAAGDPSVDLSGIDSSLAASFVAAIYDWVEGADYIDFDKLADSSQHSWDIFLRNITPETPHFLSTFASVQGRAKTEFARLWLRLRSIFSPKQLEELSSWYFAEGCKLSGPIEIGRIPKLMQG